MGKCAYLSFITWKLHYARKIMKNYKFILLLNYLFMDSQGGPGGCTRGGVSQRLSLKDSFCAFYHLLI